jgi:hypothetical protein
MVKILAIILALFFIPYLAISKAQQLRNERQARLRYFIFIIVAVLLIILLIRTL